MIDRALLLAELLADPGKASLLSREDAVALAVELARVERALELRALAPVVNGTVLAEPAEPEPEDHLLTVAEIATRLGLTERQVYRRSGRWPFTVKVGRATLRFSQAGLARWLDGRAGRGLHGA